MQYLYSVCGINLQLDIPFEICIRRESEAFLTVGVGDTPADIMMKFRPVMTLPDLSECEENGHWEGDRLYIEKNDEQWIYHCPLKNKKPYAQVIWAHNFNIARFILCNYRKESEAFMNYSHNLTSLIGLETLLLENNGLLLHASFIRWNGYGILFSAPSGTGKSTQADLWVKFRGAEIINGDRAGIMKRLGKWTAYGLPVAGSSVIYRNEYAQIQGIIVLRQAPKNHIRRLTMSEAFACLYSEIAVHSWHRPCVERVTELLTELISEVPVWQLKCRPDEEAVRLTERMLMGQTNLEV